MAGSEVELNTSFDECDEILSQPVSCFCAPPSPCRPYLGSWSLETSELSLKIEMAVTEKEREKRMF